MTKTEIFYNWDGQEFENSLNKFLKQIHQAKDLELVEIQYRPTPFSTGGNTSIYFTAMVIYKKVESKLDGIL